MRAMQASVEENGMQAIGSAVGHVPRKRKKSSVHDWDCRYHVDDTPWQLSEVTSYARILNCSLLYLGGFFVC